jgi:hypothetical protein
MIRMRFIAPTFTIALVLTCAGCGSNQQALPATAHNGSMVTLPGNKGYFEIGTEGGTKSTRGSRSKAVDNRIVVHFYQPDGTADMSPPPTEVMVKVGTAENGQVVALAPQGKGGFASAPGRFPSGFRGVLTARVDGEAVEAPFLIR